MATKLKEPKDWLLFEREVRQLVEAFGYQAEATQPSHDYGVDVIAIHQTRKVVIQCKLYGRGRVGGPTITQLIGSRTIFGATDAICITTSYFTKQASEVAAAQNIPLVDRDKLVLLCRERNLTIPSLTVLVGDGGRVFPLPVEVMSFGRAPNNHFILNDNYVSRYHACLVRGGLPLVLNDNQT